MKAGKIIAKLRDAVPVCFMVEGKEVKRYKNIELPDELKELEIKDFKFHVPQDEKIVFHLIFDKGILPEVFPAERPKGFEWKHEPQGTFAIEYLTGEEIYLKKGLDSVIVQKLFQLVSLLENPTINWSTDGIGKVRAMAVDMKYASDVEMILSHKHDNGADLWTTHDKRLIKGAPFSTLESVMYLLELGVEPTEPLLQEAASLIFSTWQEDGRFKLYPQGSVYPCQTIHAANVLCHMGYASDARLQKTLRHLFDIQHTDGGWRCSKFSFGRGPETEYSNPFPTLNALNAFRFSGYLNNDLALDKAVDFLLEHWTIRKPIGPCHYGIGTLFMQVEYPFRNYNLFVYVYVLSFYDQAKGDKRFLEALAMLESKMAEGQIVVERIVPKLSGLSFCQKGKPSALATKRYHEILQNFKTAGVHF